MSQTQPKQETLLARFWPLLLIGATWVWMFWPMMSGQTVVGFRDSAYLYYPLFQWIDAQWAAGEIPLWNPYCNFGMPVVADGSSSVFYPGKLIFFCRFLSYPARYGIYLAIHIPIAALGTYWFARTLRANQAGAALAAFSFAFGGSVLFQVTNVIFLVSAAWLPFALCCVWKMVKTGKLKWSVAGGVCCALMILGGDPQMVYHVGLIALATTVGEFVRRRRRHLKAKQTSDSGLGNRRPYRWIVQSTLRITAMVIVTSLLSAIQLLPTMIWSQHSERMHPDSPANIYQAISTSSVRHAADQYKEANQELNVANSIKNIFGDKVQILTPPKPIKGPEVYKSLLGEPVGTIDHSYQFSQPPWSLTELFWPNISGKPFPRHQRWTNSLPGAERVWNPSLYPGVLVAVLGLLGIRFWGRRRKQVWATYLFLFFTIASFGWYGAVWLSNEFFPNSGTFSGIGPQVGGVYWAMNMLLPKYFAFRYPAKLFVIAALAISLLAGLNLRSERLRRSRLTSKIAAVFLAISTAGIVGLLLYFRPMLEQLRPDAWFGQFDAFGAEFGLYFSLVQPILIVLAVVCLFAYSGRDHWKVRFGPVIVTLCIFDVVVANHWLLAQVPTTVFTNETQISLGIKNLDENDIEPLRIFRDRDFNMEPAHWLDTSSNDRLAEVVKWQRESLYPKWHLNEDVILVGSFSSVWPKSYEMLLQGLDILKREASSQRIFKFEQSGRNLLRTRVVADPELRLKRNRDLHEFGIVEMTIKGRSSDEIGISTVKEFSANRVLVSSRLELPSTLHFFVFADSGWQATVTDSSSNQPKPTILNPRESGIGFDLKLEPGEYEIEFKYSPIEFWIGAWVSGIGWLMVIGGSQHYQR